MVVDQWFRCGECDEIPAAAIDYHGTESWEDKHLVASNMADHAFKWSDWLILIGQFWLIHN